MAAHLLLILLFSACVAVRGLEERVACGESIGEVNSNQASIEVLLILFS